MLDAGSGLIGLGGSLGGSGLHVPILLTHYHWDHLVGLPLFAPLYRLDCSSSVWAPALASDDGRSIRTLFQPPFYSVPDDQLSPPAIHSIRPGACDISGFEVRAIALNHPGGAFAYRIRGAGGDLVYATDHEVGDPNFDEPLAEFARGAYALVFDAQFTPIEEDSHRGWGHSTWEQAARFASKASVRHLYLFHHNPGRTDAELGAIEAEARAIFPATSAAREGVSFDL